MLVTIVFATGLHATTALLTGGVWDGGGDVFDSGNSERSASFKAPNSTILRRVFDDIAADPDFSQQPNRSDIKLVVGIMAYAPLKWDSVHSYSSGHQNYEYRQAHRETWMRLKAVCRAEYGAFIRPECLVFPVFVLGNRSMTASEFWCSPASAQILDRNTPNNCSQRYATPLDQARRAEPPAFGELRPEAEMHRDLVFLHGEPENMNIGKTYAWLEFAVRAYPWATHIAKMDIDTYPFIQPLLSAIPIRHQAPMGPKCGLEVRSRPARFQCLGTKFRHNRNYVIHGGSLIILSQLLARQVTAPEGHWRRRILGTMNEDAELSAAVLVEAKLTCVDWGDGIRNAWLHFGRCGPNGEDSPNHCGPGSKMMYNYTQLKRNLLPDPP